MDDFVHGSTCIRGCEMTRDDVIIKVMNKLINSLVLFFVVILLLYSGYSIWNNQRVYADVDEISGKI